MAGMDWRPIDANVKYIAEQLDAGNLNRQIRLING
jgi:hypothetical protein